MAKPVAGDRIRTIQDKGRKIEGTVLAIFEDFVRLDPSTLKGKKIFPGETAEFIYQEGLWEIVE